jgi:hypothetical protein
MADVKIVKLSNSQEIIAKIMSSDDQTINVESPLVLQPMRSSETSLSIGMVPFTWAGRPDSWIGLNKSHVLCIMEPEEELKTQYLAGLSGITLPQRSPGKLTLVE